MTLFTNDTLHSARDRGVSSPRRIFLSRMRSRGFRPPRSICSTRPSAPRGFEKTVERLRAGRLPAPGLALVAKEAGELIGTLRLWHVRCGRQCPPCCSVRSPSPKPIVRAGLAAG